MRTAATRSAQLFVGSIVLMVLAAFVPALPSPAQERGGIVVEDTVGHLQVRRFAGANRGDTARLIGTDVGGAAFSGEAVLVARADAFPDSLAGSYLAGVLDAPVLLTDRTAVTPELAAALAALDPDSVVLLGGEGALSAEVSAQLSASYAVQRVAGGDRFATAAAVARQIGEPSPAAAGLALVASGETFADALAAGTIAAAEQVPLLLTGRDRLPEATSAALEDLGIEEVVMAGGSAAVGNGVQAAIEALGIEVVRAAGSNRQGTARALAELAVERFGWDPTSVTVVNGNDFPDAVAVAPHAGLRAGGPSPIALTAGEVLGVETTAWLEDLAGCSLVAVDIAGGEAAVPSGVADAAVAALTPAGGCAGDGGGGGGGGGDGGGGDVVDDVPPAVTFTAPAEGAAVTMGADGITLSGTASDAASGIARVEIRVDALGDAVIATAVPESDGDFTWSVEVTPAEPGTYSFTATAIDAAGNTATDVRTVDVAFPADDAVLVFDDVRVLDATAAACITGVTETEVLLSCALEELGVAERGAGADTVTTGDLLVSGPTPAAPGGLARRLGACAAEGEGLRCGAPPARLTEIFAQVDTAFQVPVTPSEQALIATDDPNTTITPMPTPPATPIPIDPDRGRLMITRDGEPTEAGTSQFAVRLIDKQWRTSFDVDLADAGVPVPLELTGAIEAFLYLDVALDIDVDWCWGVVPCGVEVEHFKVELGGGEQLEAEYNLGTEGGGDIEVERKLGSVNLGSFTFTIFGIPIVVSGVLSFHIGIDGELVGVVTGRASQTLTLATGIEYTSEDGWRDLSRVDWEHDFSRVTDTGNVAARVRPYVAIQLDLDVYGVSGPYVRGEPYILLDVDSARDPLFNLYIGFRAAAGIEVDPLGIDYEAELFDVSTLVATSANYPPDSPPVVTIVGPDGFPPVLQQRQPPLSGVGNPRPFFCCDVLLDYTVDFTHPTETPEQLTTRWTAENVENDDVRTFFEVDPDAARLTLPPGVWDITAQVVNREFGNPRGTPDAVRVRVYDRPEIGVTPVTPDDAGALALAQAAGAASPGLVTGARFETLPDGAPAAHGTAGPGACTEGSPATRDCPTGVPGLVSAALLTTGSAAEASGEREPAAPASGGDPALITDGVRGTSDGDVTVLAVDLDVPEEATCLRFDYRYATEEAPQYVGTRFNDGFVAELDATTWTTTGVSELEAPASFARTAGGLLLDTNTVHGAAARDLNAAWTTYDYATHLLRAATPITPGAHTLYLSIFDQGDRSYDSAVFLADLVAADIPADACVPGAAPRANGPALTR